MQQYKRNIFFISGLAIAFSATLIFLTTFFPRGNDTVHNTNEFNKWLNNPAHNCIKTKEIAGVKIVVKYQPPSYVALKESEAGISSEKESTQNGFGKQKNLVTFLMTIGPAEKNGENTHRSVMADGINNHDEYVQRVMDANFYMDKYLKLYIDDEALDPVLSIVENVYELSENRNFLVVFAIKEEKINKSKDFLFVYDDPFFNMGKVQFDFRGKDMENARRVSVVRK